MMIYTADNTYAQLKIVTPRPAVAHWRAFVQDLHIIYRVNI